MQSHFTRPSLYNEAIKDPATIQPEASPQIDQRCPPGSSQEVGTRVHSLGDNILTQSRKGIADEQLAKAELERERGRKRERQSEDPEIRT